MVIEGLPAQTAAELQAAVDAAEKFHAFQTALDTFGDCRDVRGSRAAALAGLDGVIREFSLFCPSTSLSRTCEASPEYHVLRDMIHAARSELMKLSAAVRAPNFPDTFVAAVDAFRSGSAQRIREVLTWLEAEIRNNAVAPGARPLRHAACASECLGEALFAMECAANNLTEESSRSDRIAYIVDAYHCVQGVHGHLRQIFHSELLAPREVESLSDVLDHVLEAIDFLGGAFEDNGFLRDVHVLDGIDSLDRPVDLAMESQFCERTCREFDIRIRGNLKTAKRRLDRVRTLGPAAVLGALSVDWPTENGAPEGGTEVAGRELHAEDSADAPNDLGRAILQVMVSLECTSSLHSQPKHVILDGKKEERKKHKNNDDPPLRTKLRLFGLTHIMSDGIADSTLRDSMKQLLREKYILKAGKSRNTRYYLTERGVEAGELLLIRP